MRLYKRKKIRKISAQNNKMQKMQQARDKEEIT